MRTSSTPLRTFAAIALTGMVVAACGQKPTVAHISNGVDGGGGATDVAGFQTDTQGAVTDTTGGTTTDLTGGVTTDATGGATAGDPTPTDTSGGTTTGGSTPDTSGGTTGGTQQPAGNAGTTTEQPSTEGGGGGGGGGGEQAAPPANQPTGSDRTGVTDAAITLAVHAPATGAAPLPTTSFENARETYWRWVTSPEGGGQKILGRSTVKVEYADDKYAPDTAINVCRNLASKSFLLVGGGGTDQIQACGQLANQASFPYFSAGVTEAGLAGNPWYFAASMSYRQQGGLLAQYVKKNPDKIARLGPSAKIGTIITNTPNFKDARDGWLQGVQANGLTNIDTFEHPKGDTSWYAATAQRFQQQGIEVVYFLSSPVDYLNFANTANERFGYNPQYIGVGISKGLNAVLASGCGDPDVRIDNGIFLHPYQGLDKADPEFKKASAALGTPSDDIAYALWGLAKTQHELFKKYEATFGTDLTREDFRALVEGGSGTIESGVYPKLQYSPQSHFGANSAHVLQANCETKKHDTLQQFATGF